MASGISPHVGQIVPLPVINDSNIPNPATPSNANSSGSGLLGGIPSSPNEILERIRSGNILPGDVSRVPGGVQPIPPTLPYNPPEPQPQPQPQPQPDPWGGSDPIAALLPQLLASYNQPAPTPTVVPGQPGNPMPYVLLGIVAVGGIIWYLQKRGGG